MVLDVEPPGVPDHRPIACGQFAPGPFRVVGGEAEDGHDTCSGWSRVEVAPLPGLLEQDRPAAAQLGQISPRYVSDQSEKVCSGVELPGDARCSGRGRSLRPGRRTRGPPSSGPPGTATIPVARADHPEGVGVADPSASASAACSELAAALRRLARARGRDVARPPSPGPGRSGRARPPGAPAGGRAPGSRPRGSGRRCSGRRRPTSRCRSRVRSSAAIWLGVAAAEAEPAQAELQPPQEQGPEAPAGACSAASCRPRPRTVRRAAEPLVDVAADQELHGRAASELERPRRRRPRRRPPGIPAPPRRPARRWPGRRPSFVRSCGPPSSPGGRSSRARR